VISISSNDRYNLKADHNHVVYKIAVIVNRTGRNGNERGGRQSDDRPEVPPQIKNQQDGHKTEHDGDHPDRERVEAKQSRYQRKIIKRRSVIVRGIVMVKSVTHEAREKESIDTLVVMERFQLEMVRTQQR